MSSSNLFPYLTPDAAQIMPDDPNIKRNDLFIEISKADYANNFHLLLFNIQLCEDFWENLNAKDADTCKPHN